MKYILVCALVLSVNSLFSQTIKASEAGSHLNEKATVCDSVYGARWLDGANGQPTLVNMGGVYPNNPFTFVIFGENRSKFSYKPEEYLLNHSVCVTGQIVEFRGKPQIVVSDSSQVTIKK